MTNWYLIYAYALGLSFVVSAVLTSVMRRAAMRWRILDHPGERKMQQSPMPLLGGVAIFATFNLVIFVNLLLLKPVRLFGFDWLELHVFSFLGGDVKWKLLGLSLGGCVMFALGLVDDLKALRPEAKLAGQIAAALIVVLSGIRLDLFIPDVWDSVWTVRLVSGLATMLWIILMTNAMNFLDNMDGLCAGVSVIAAVSMFVSLAPQDTFVCVLLAVFAGAAAGFLYHNLSPARIFMGDSGALFCGYVLAVAPVLATFYTEGSPSRVAVLAPLVALSVPLFDTGGVIFLRWRSGESIMKGDKRHFSHRLVAAGMTPRRAVEFIFLVTAVTGLGAVLLRQLDLWGSMIILAQVAGIFGLIVLLMNVNHNKNRPSS